MKLYLLFNAALAKSAKDTCGEYPKLKYVSESKLLVNFCLNKLQFINLTIYK